MEKSKSVLLLEALMSAKAERFAQVPDSLLEKERLLRSEITSLEKELIKNTNEKEKLKSDIFLLKEQQAGLMKFVSANYPDYYSLRYGANVTDPNSFSKELDPDELMISYFYGNQAIYALSISQQSKNLIKIPLDKALENKIKEVHEMLSDSKSDISDLSNLTYELYGILIAPLLSSPETSKLTLITDGLLSYLPFSALNTDSNGLTYLVENYAISYANSATLLKQLNEREPASESQMLAFAPSFDGKTEVSLDRSKLLPLPHNKKEVAQISKSFDGRSFVDKEASLDRFRSEAKGFTILHLATHAIFDDSTPEYSYLAFAQVDQPIDESILFVADLYNLRTDVDLVTLSACETGIGELKRGEGFLSLARGFFYSGAASIASTLWKVNDASSTQLMDSFYKNLAEGKTKDQALQKAKKTFIKDNSQNALAHPYYWSGFVISGNTSPLISSNIWSWLILGIVGLSILLGLYFLKKRKS
ncbi:CHAT domain-containing protein [Maribacter halichondriae]|uniref:CHAT domain-containing protein n=1 Tax=Maribacter halichondriae TaxID=2980554 RepID=UPI002358AA49|nr:CHAT domain-containing protein [Maribacter sp. Hal144]